MFTRNLLIGMGTVCLSFVALAPLAEAEQVCSCRYYQGGVCYDMSCEDSHGSSSYYSSNNRSSSNYRYSSSSANFDITTTSSMTTVRAGDTVTFTIRIRNASSYDDDTRVTATLDPDMSFVSASDGGDDYSDDVTWDRIRVDARDTETLTLRVRIDNTARDGDTLRLRVKTDDDSDEETIRVDDYYGSSSNCRSTSSYNYYGTRYCDPYRNGSVDLDVIDDRDPIRPGDTLTYRIVLTNHSNYSTTTDVLGFMDTDTSFDSASDNGRRLGSDEVEWRSISLRSNETRTLTLRVRLDSGINNGSSLSFRAETDTDSVTETTRVDGYSMDYGSSSICTYYNSYRRENYQDYCDTRHESARRR